MAVEGFNPSVLDTQIDAYITSVEKVGCPNVPKFALDLIKRNGLSLNYADKGVLRRYIQGKITASPQVKQIIEKTETAYHSALKHLTAERDYAFNEELEELETSLRDASSGTPKVKKEKITKKISDILGTLKPLAMRCEALFQSLSCLHKALGTTTSRSRREFLDLSTRSPEKHLAAIKKAASYGQQDTVKFLFETAKVMGIYDTLIEIIKPNRSNIESLITSDKNQTTAILKAINPDLK